MLLLGSVYPRLPTRVCVPQRVRKPRRNTPCGKHVRLGSPRPQAQGARRVSAFRCDIDENGGGPRITRTPRAWTPSFIAATEPLPAAQMVKPEACSSFDAFLSVKKSMRSLLSKGEEYVVFSPTRKRRKESPRLSSRTLMLLLRSTYTRLERCCSARRARTGHHSPCGK